MFIGAMVNDQLVWQPELSAFQVAHADEHKGESEKLDSIKSNQEGFQRRVSNIERLILMQTIRDISGEIRALETRKDSGEWSDIDQRLLDRAENDLADAQRELDQIDDD